MIPPVPLPIVLLVNLRTVSGPVNKAKSAILFPHPALAGIKALHGLHRLKSLAM